MKLYFFWVIESISLCFLRLLSWFLFIELIWIERIKWFRKLIIYKMWENFVREVIDLKLIENNEENCSDGGCWLWN